MSTFPFVPGFGEFRTSTSLKPGVGIKEYPPNVTVEESQFNERGHLQTCRGPNVTTYQWIEPQVHPYFEVPNEQR